MICCRPIHRETTLPSDTQRNYTAVRYTEKLHCRPIHKLQDRQKENRRERQAESDRQRDTDKHKQRKRERKTEDRDGD